MTTSARAARPSEALSRDQLLEMYYFARLVILFRQSKVIGGLYRSLGQEGESVATAYALDRGDAVLPLIRNMGALTTIGVRPREIFLQYMARADSSSRGRDLNIHIVHLPDWTRDPHVDGASPSPEPVVVGPMSMLGDSIRRRGHRPRRADAGPDPGRHGVDRRSSRSFGQAAIKLLTTPANFQLRTRST